MQCIQSKSHPNLFSYMGLLRKPEHSEDIRRLFEEVLKKNSRLIVFGGVYGDPLTGCPVRGFNATQGFQINIEHIKRELKDNGVSMVYINLGIYTSEEGKIHFDKQRLIRQLILEYVDKEYFTILAWSHSTIWTHDMGL